MPFLFIYTSILNVGWNFNFILTVIDACIALVAWGAALEGHLFKKTTWYERIALFAAAVGLLHEGHRHGHRRGNAIFASGHCATEGVYHEVSRKGS